MTTASPLLLRGGLVIDPAAGRVEPMDILVENGVMTRLAASGRLPAENAVVHDATGRLILPGLVNSHTHGHMSLQRGVADRWTLEASLINAPWLAGHRDPQAMYASTLLAAADMLMRGCTTCFDLVYEYPLPTVEGFLAVAKAYADAGMRAVLAPMVFDIPLLKAIPGLFEALPADLQRKIGRDPDSEAVIAAVEAIVAERHRLPAGISLAVAPTIPHHCSKDFLLRCVGIADRHGLPIHMHIAESRLQAVTAQRRYGCSPIAYLAELGVLRKGFTAAHSVWLDDADLDILADRSCSVAHIPASNLRLGVGFAHIRPMLERGITVGLATDGANSSDSLSMLQAMRLASYGARAYAEPREAWLSALETIRIATAGGADLAGLEKGGRIVEGAPADLVFFDLSHIDFLPLTDPLNQIVTCADTSTVADVMASGRFVVRNRSLVPAVFSDLRERVTEARLRVMASGIESRALSAELEPHVVAFAQSLAGEPLGMERFLQPRGPGS